MITLRQIKRSIVCYGRLAWLLSKPCLVLNLPGCWANLGHMYYIVFTHLFWNNYRFIDSWKKYRKVSYILYTSLSHLTTYINIVHQEIYICTAHKVYSDVNSNIRIHLCMYSSVQCYQSISNQDADLFYYPGSLVLHFYRHVPNTNSYTWQPLICFLSL